MTRQLEVREYRSVEELAPLRRSWDQLVEGSASASIFSTWEWLISWWRAHATDGELLVLGFFADSKLVGLAPLALASSTVLRARPLRVLRFLGDGSDDSDHLDFPALKGQESSIAATLLSFLAADARWDICQLNLMPPDSAVGGQVRALLDGPAWRRRYLERSRSAIELPESWEAYRASLSRKERGKVGYRRRRLTGRQEVRVCRNASELPRFLSTLYELHGKRWIVRGHGGSFAHPARRLFYELMAGEFLARGWLEFWQLDLDGKPVASQFGFHYRDTVFSLQEGFDPDYRTDSVGYVLRSYVLEDMLRRGMKRYDFLGGEDSSKSRWGTSVDHYFCLHFARARSPGSIVLAFAETSAAFKEWLRRILPPRAWGLLRWLNRAVRRM